MQRVPGVAQELLTRDRFTELGSTKRIPEYDKRDQGLHHMQKVFSSVHQKAGAIEVNGLTL